MAEYLIQDITLIAIADAIKAKTGKSDLLTPSEMVAAIESLPEGGGGSVDERVKYVTFMYGTTELTKYPVIAGDTVREPVAEGYIDAPTKKPVQDGTTITYYSFGGWSLTDDGTVDSNALTNVTEDRTVYVVFESHEVEVIASGVCGDNAIWGLSVEGIFTVAGYGAMYDYAAAEDRPWNSYAENITSVVIEDGITTTGVRSFIRCTNLKDIQIAGSVTSIENFAFYDCDSLTSVTIPDSVTSIGKSAFYECASLASVTIGNSVTIIVDYAFYGCSSLTNIHIPANVKKIGQYAFYGTGLTAMSFTIYDWYYTTSSNYTGGTYTFLSGGIQTARSFKGSNGKYYYYTKL